MTRIKILPLDDRANGWAATLPPHTPNPPLHGTITADFAVIGAGFAGLAAARRLARLRPDAHIVIVDAQEVAEGASGRNSGFAIDLPHNLGAALDELAKGEALRRLGRAALASLRGTVRRHDIRCDWSEIGKYHAAASNRGAKHVLRPTADALDRMGEAYEWLDRDEARDRLGTDHFAAAIYTPGTVLMNPAALTRGLGASLPDNVTLYENTPVIRASFNQPTLLETPTGSIRTPKTIIAVNGLTTQFGFWKGRLLNVAAHASLTRPLSDAEHAELGGVAPWGLTPANAMVGITMRYTNDRRILIRQNIHYCPRFRQSATRRQAIRRSHQRLFQRRFPMLEKVTMAHTWTGYMSLSLNSAPAFGQVAPDVWTAACQNGVGITRGTIGGMLAADMALGEDNPLIADMLSLGQPPRLPIRPVLAVGAPLRMAAARFLNRDEA